MKQVKIFALALLLSFPSISFCHSLKGPFLPIFNKYLIDTIDGSKVDGETVGKIKKYQMDMRNILCGKLQQNKTHLGQYLYGDAKYSLSELARIEEEEGTSSTFATLLKKMRSDFEKISEPFRAIVKTVTVKAAMEVLIKESCALRGREEGDCLLLEWAKPGNKDEHKLFDHHIQNIAIFETFLIDLNNFLHDLIESCPKAQAQFFDRLEKYKIVRSLLPETGIDTKKEGEALKKIYLHLNSMKIEEITLNKIKEILKS